MILEWMLYTLAVTLLFAWAAWALEEIAVTRGIPARSIWIAAVIGSLLLPQALHLRPRTGPSVTLSIRGVEMPWAAQRSPTSADPGDAAIAPARYDLDDELKVVWGASSLLVMGLFATSAALVARRRRRWKLQVMSRRRIWVSADTGPAVVGFFPGEIVLPEWILGSPAADQRLAVTHEEEHIRSRDPMIVFGIAVICAAMPWNVPLWWIASRLRHAIELDCDRRLVNSGFNRRSYSRLLIEVTERGLPHYMAVTGLSGSPSFLEKRIRLLLGRRAQSPVRSGALALIAAVVLLAAYSIDPPAGLAEERTPVGEADGAVRSAVEIFQVAAENVRRAAGEVEITLPTTATGAAETGAGAADTLPLSAPVEIALYPTPDATVSNNSSGSIASRPGDRQIELCVVENGSLQTVPATFRAEAGDTLLGSTLLSDLPASSPDYAQETSWYQQKERVAFEGVEWVLFGSERRIAPEMLQSAGTVNGIAVFMEAGRSADNIHVLYVPLRPGCYFQQYQRVAGRIRY